MSTTRVNILVLSRNPHGCPQLNLRNLFTLSNSMMWPRAVPRTTTLINLRILGLSLAEPRNILIKQNTNLGRYLPSSSEEDQNNQTPQSDPTIGEEGMETPLPNDSSKASHSPPVGGRLRSFRRDWQTNKCLSNVLNITNGYVLPFLLKPSLVRFPLILSEYKALQKDQALADCIQSILSKNAIKRVENVKSLGFYSRLFLVPKQRWRPVIIYMKKSSKGWKIETPESIRTSLVPWEWISLIDLSDAYLHIPIHPNSMKYLKFCNRSQVFQFTSLPFGLAIAH